MSPGRFLENTQEADPALIANYSEGCRSRVPAFLEQHYSFKKVWELQKNHILHDLWKLALNSLWAIPYLGLKKGAEYIDKAGWSTLLYWMEYLPTGFKTYVPDYFEKQIAAELFQVQNERDVKISIVRKELKKYAVGRTIVANFSTSITTLILGKIFFDRGNIDIFGLVSGIGGYMARDRAASDFIFGKDLGRAFYSVVTPEVSWIDLFLASVVFFLFLSFVAGVFSTLYFPLRKKLGLEEKKLHRMIKEIEHHLLLESYSRKG
ncbi:MAG: DUF6635 family protein [Pseudomonadota bacterium]|nr:DUF6635 family protein [Pseudomonadota bacterium]